MAEHTGETSTDLFSILPRELWITILRRVAGDHLASFATCGRVNYRMLSLFEDESIWRALCEKNPFFNVEPKPEGETWKRWYSWLIKIRSLSRC
jgi:hypothetical protein